ncbi:hypothetical protein [Alkalihalobacillus sp. AL-G]|uniref:hypothetical protein n=1 Tax=Alkalihalobacillus sp. AL-G TaxID=2926399 RepID=UPI00272D12EC|nr:hypothetical protein [Alkalihalobacillus sp. AL-G]WLD93811.1 hypothetical protein MOJ78_02525 [Alkalihalobacillus sp. AL-G]
MKFTVHYIPLNKIKPDSTVKITDHIKKLRTLMWDCMYILVVKKDRNSGRYVLISGRERYEHLRNHTKNIYAPCIVDKSAPPGTKPWFVFLPAKQPLDDFPLTPKSWSIVRCFLKKEPRFSKLSRIQQIKVLLLGARYKRTVILSMQTKVNQLLRDSG